MLVIDTQTMQIISKIKVGKSPAGIAINHTGDFIYITNREDNNLMVINQGNRKNRTYH